MPLIFYRCEFSGQNPVSIGTVYAAKQHCYVRIERSEEHVQSETQETFANIAFAIFANALYTVEDLKSPVSVIALASPTFQSSFEIFPNALYIVERLMSPVSVITLASPTLQSSFAIFANVLYTVEEIKSPVSGIAQAPPALQ